MDQFTVAAAILEAFGGTRERAWALAGELLAEGQEPESIWLGLYQGTPLHARYDGIRV